MIPQFHFLPHIAFETPEDESDIKTRGLAKWKRSEVSEEALELGREFISQIEASYIPEVSIRFVNQEVGFGLFVEEDLKEGAYVGEYTGIVRKNDRRYFEPLNNYCYEYPIPDDIGRSFVTDATQGHLTRFINHSATPNLKPIHVFYEGFYHLIFLAQKQIPRGAQLSFDYGKNYWYIRQPPQVLI